MAAGDYGFRIRRRAGVNAITDLIQVGTGSLTINALNGADTVFTNTNVGIGVTSSATKLDISVTPSAPWMKLINANETAFNLTTYNNGTNNGSSVYAFKHGLYYGNTENAAVTFYRGGSSVGGFLTFTTMVLFGADDQPWGKTIGALKNGLVLDGPVTLILERERDVERAVAWIAEGTPAEKPTRQLKKKTQTRIETATDATGSRETTGASRDSRVSSISSANAPDPLNAAFAAAGISFVLLIVAGFS
jgi:hypothetical protein